MIELTEFGKVVADLARQCGYARLADLGLSINDMVQMGLATVDSSPLTGDEFRAVLEKSRDR